MEQTYDYPSQLKLDINCLDIQSQFSDYLDLFLLGLNKELIMNTGCFTEYRTIIIGTQDLTSLSAGAEDQGVRVYSTDNSSACN
jgi:hypothetical protein